MTHRVADCQECDFVGDRHPDFDEAAGDALEHHKEHRHNVRIAKVAA